MNMASALRPDLPPELKSSQLMRALDASHMRQVLSAALGEAVGAVSIERTLFSASRPTVIHYRYQRFGEKEPKQLIGELVGAGAEHGKETEIRRLGKARRSQIGQSTDSPLFHDDDTGLVLRRPGFDSNLLGLRLLHDKAFAAQMLANIIGHPVNPTAFNISLKAHRLGKRAVLLVDCMTASGTRHRIYVRLRPTTHEAGRASFERHVHIAQHMQNATTARIPAALQFDADWGAAFFEELPGMPPGFAGVQAAASGALAGKAMGEWRKLTPVADTQWFSENEIAGLNVWAAHLSAHFPQKLPDFNRALQVVSNNFSNLPTVPPAPCHRDFHEAQLLIAGNQCGILDFDTWCNADPALDVGNFLAHIRLWELRNAINAVPFTSSFTLAASAGQPSGFAERISVWKRASLLRLAAIYAFTSEMDHVVRQLAAEAGA